MGHLEVLGLQERGGPECPVGLKPMDGTILEESCTARSRGSAFL